MAVLGDNFATFVKREARVRDTFRTEVRAANPTKDSLLAGFQALEDGYNAERLALKALIDTAMGITTTNTLAKQMEDIWMDWKGSN